MLFYDLKLYTPVQGTLHRLRDSQKRDLRITCERCRQYNLIYFSNEDIRADGNSRLNLFWMRRFISLFTIYCIRLPLNQCCALAPGYSTPDWVVLVSKVMNCTRRRSRSDPPRFRWCRGLGRSSDGDLRLSQIATLLVARRSYWLGGGKSPFHAVWCQLDR